MRQKINAHVRKAEREAPEYYDEFIEKFRPNREHKPSTDDCMTPETVYQAVLDWARAEYNIGPETRIVRPFWPEADYRAEDYSGDCVVIDNPPFSILSQICRWYQEHGIRFLLFAPTMTLFSVAAGTMNYVVCDRQITYLNGVVVNTSFVTNMGGWKIHCAPELQAATTAANKAQLEQRTTKWKYPPSVCNAAGLHRIARNGIPLKIRACDTHFVRALDAQKAVSANSGIYGTGFLLSERATAARIAAEEAAAEQNETQTLELSDRERGIIAKLSGRN